jgi:hypothetical protein
MFDDSKKYRKIESVENIFYEGILNCLETGSAGFGIRGENNKIKALKSALNSSKDFLNELNSNNTSLQLIMEKLKYKNKCVREFENITGLDWPL